MSGRVGKKRAGAAVALCALAAALGFVSGGCAGSPATKLPRFSTEWVDDGGESMNRVFSRIRSSLQRASLQPSPALAVGVVRRSGGPGTNTIESSHGDRLVAHVLGSAVRWSFDHRIDSRPVIAQGVVVAFGAGELVALEGVSGRVLWRTPASASGLLGASDDGATTAVTLAQSQGSRLVVINRAGEITRDIYTQQRFGEPASVGGVVFVPWGRQYVSALSISSGDELGRVTLGDVVSKSVRAQGSFYFGEIALVRLDEHFALASQKQASRYALTTPEALPGAPRLFASALDPQPVEASAFDRVRLFALPESRARVDGTLYSDADRYFASYFRLLFGFDASAGRLTWVRRLPSADGSNPPPQVVGGSAARGGLVACGEGGEVVAFEAIRGDVVYTGSLGQPVRSCVVSVGDWTVPASSASSASTSEGLVDQIREAVTDSDASLMTAQRWLVRQLATDDDDASTRVLIELATTSRTGALLLVGDATEALATRRSGEAAMLDALQTPWRRNENASVSATDVAPLPLGALADALASMHSANAAPLLTRHLMHFATSGGDLRRVAAALRHLATPAQYADLRLFFAMYRGTAESDDVARAVAYVGKALVRLEPVAGRDIVARAASDSMTEPRVREALRAELPEMFESSAPMPAP